MARRLNDWARRVWLHCAALGQEQGITVAEAERLFGGPPPPTANTGRRLMEHAATRGFFRSVKERHRDGAQGRWYRARYFAIGPEPEALRPGTSRGSRPAQSLFGNGPAAASVFALGDLHLDAINKTVSAREGAA